MTMFNSGGGDADLYRIGIEWLGSGKPKAPGGGESGPYTVGTGADRRIEAEGVKRDQENNQNIKEGVRQGKGFLRNTLGIQVGVASLLKQSQIFTGVLGTIFQILGAMVDVILAAFLPIIVPALKLMAKSIPEVQQQAVRIREWIEKVVAWVRKTGEDIRDRVPARIKNALKEIIIGGLVVFFISKIIPIHTLVIGTLKWGFHLLWNTSKANARLLGMMRADTQTIAASTMVPNGLFDSGGMPIMRPVPGAVTGGNNSRGRVARGYGMGAGGAALMTAGAFAIPGMSGMGAGIGGSAGMLVGGMIGAFGGPMGVMIGSTAGSIIGGIVGGVMNQAYLNEEERKVAATEGKTWNQIKSSANLQNELDKSD